MQKYHGDAVVGFCYASIEHEAFGGKTIFFEDGPPNAGAPIVNKIEDISKLKVPKIENQPGLQKVLKIIKKLKQEVGDEVPVMAFIISPYSLPIM